jgi:6-phosphogluconate dehydrogenase
MSAANSDIGLIGLAVMGQNLALNIADHGFQISVYNRTVEKTRKFVAENPNTPGGLVGSKTLEEFVAIACPARSSSSCKAGAPDGRRDRRPHASPRKRHHHRRWQRPLDGYDPS